MFSDRLVQPPTGNLSRISLFLRWRLFLRAMNLALRSLRQGGSSVLLWKVAGYLLFAFFSMSCNGIFLERDSNKMVVYMIYMYVVHVWYRELRWVFRIFPVIQWLITCVCPARCGSSEVLHSKNWALARKWWSLRWVVCPNHRCEIIPPPPTLVGRSVLKLCLFDP